VSQDTVMHAMAHGEDETARRRDGKTARRPVEATTADVSSGASMSATLDEPGGSR
jgi:hypothetical protein